MRLHASLYMLSITKQQEVKMYRIIGVLMLILTGCAGTEKIEKSSVKLELKEIKGSRFITGIDGAENICLEQSSMRVYISDIAGYITVLDGEDFSDLKIVKTKKVGELVLGLAQDSKGYIYAGICNYNVDEWRDKGGAVYRFSSDIDSMIQITPEYSGINGITIDNQDQLFFASSNFDPYEPEGCIYKISLANFSEPEIFIEDAGMANGLYYDPNNSKIFFSDTITGVYTFSSDKPQLNEVFKSQRFWGVIDDLGTDSQGRVWMSDPGSSFFQCYDPVERKVTYFNMKEFGHASSCRIRNENGEDIIYITELTMEGKGIYDGRGLVIIPLKSLEQYL